MCIRDSRVGMPIPMVVAYAAAMLLAVAWGLQKPNSTTPLGRPPETDALSWRLSEGSWGLRLPAASLRTGWSAQCLGEEIWPVDGTTGVMYITVCKQKGSEAAADAFWQRCSPTSLIAPVHANWHGLPRDALSYFWRGTGNKHTLF